MKTVKLFRNGQSQAVRLPKEFRFEGEAVYIKKVGNAVMLLPVVHSWDGLLGSLNKFSPDFLDARQQPEQTAREELFA